MNRNSVAKLTLILAAQLALVACGGAAVEEAEATLREVPSAKAVRIEVVRLEPSRPRLSLDLPGEVGGSRDALLAASNGGFVESVSAVEGDRVTKGQVLMRIDSSTHAAQLEIARAQLDQVDTDLARLDKLGDLGTAMQRTQLVTQRRVAAANVDLASTRLTRALVRAPFGGVVAKIDVEVGEAAAPGAPVARVVQLDPAVIELSVADRDVIALAPGMPVTVSVSARAEPWSGIVSRVSPAADLQTRAFPVEVEVPNPDGRLLPGMIARVAIERELDGDSVLLPQDWLVTRREERGVFLAVDGVAKWRPVELGEVVHDSVVVRSGLAAGDPVVVTGQRDLVDGDPVLVSREGTCCSQGRPVFQE